MIDRTLIFLVVLALVFVALVVGFVAGIVMTLTGSNGNGLAWSCGMPLMVMLMGVACSRKRK